MSFIPFFTKKKSQRMTRRMLLQNSATRGHRKNMTSFFFVLKLIFNLFFDLKHPQTL
jgi:hypothetical protein